MDKYFTVSVGSEIPTPEGYLKVKAIHFHKDLFVEEYVLDEEGNEKFVYDYLISKFDCEKYLKAVDGKNHIIFIKEE